MITVSHPYILHVSHLRVLAPNQDTRRHRDLRSVLHFSSSILFLALHQMPPPTLAVLPACLLARAETLVRLAALRDRRESIVCRWRELEQPLCADVRHCADVMPQVVETIFVEDTHSCSQGCRLDDPHEGCSATLPDYG